MDIIRIYTKKMYIMSINSESDIIVVIITY